MRYVITGGAGFIGSNLVEALVSKGEEVVVIDDLSSGRLENLKPFLSKIKFVKGSILDFNLLKKEFKGADFVLHQAAVVSVPLSIEKPIETSEVGIRGTLNALLAAKENNVKRFVYASSAAVYGDDPQMPKKEDMLPVPLSPYAVQKLTAEHFCKVFHQLYGVETVALRYFNVFGPKQDPNSPYSGVISLFIKSMLEGKQPVIFGDGKQSRDFIFVEDVVQANLLACQAKNLGGVVINIATAKKTTVNDLVLQLNILLGKDIKPVYSASRKGDIKHSLADIEKAKRLLGFEPRFSFAQGLKKTVEW